MFTKSRVAAILSAGVLMASASQALAAPTINIADAGKRMIVQNTGDVIATFLSSSAALSDSLYLVGRAGVIFNNKTSAVGSTVDLGTFTAGTELVFRLTNETTSPLTFHSYYTGPANRNVDGVAHAAVTTAGSLANVGFEDLSGGGDKDYNDLIFSVSNVAGAVPEPATWAMMILGVGAIGFSMRSAKRRSNEKFDAKIKRITDGALA